MVRKILLITATGILLILSSCNSNPVIPPEIQPGRRDYVWTTDTIKIFSNYIHSIWGSSPDDIWGVGPGGALNTTIWHYNGNEWTTDGVSRNISPYCVYGFAKNDVWIASANGKIWHWDGNNWSENYQHTINGFIGIDFYDLYGINNHDLYAVGTVWFNNETRRGIILHYDGRRWEQKYLANFNSLFIEVKISLYKNCFITCVKQDVINYGIDTTVLYEYNAAKLNEIYNDKNKNMKGARISIIGGTPYFILENVICTYKENQAAEFFKTNSAWTPSFCGRNEKDIFLGTSNGIEHYNGSDIQLLLTKDGFNSGILFDKEVFLLNTTLQNGESIIYHGKLK